MKNAILFFWVVQLGIAGVVVGEDAWEELPLKKVSEIDLPASALEGEWK